jgi:hypothetical protein
MRDQGPVKWSMASWDAQQYGSSGSMTGAVGAVSGGVVGDGTGSWFGVGGRTSLGLCFGGGVGMQCPATQVLLASGGALFLDGEGLSGARGGMLGWARVVNADTCKYPEPRLLCMI